MLSDEEIRRCYEAGFAHNGLLAKHSFPRSARAIESAATAPLLDEIARLTRELEEARKDAERYRFIRDADRSDCISLELSLYAMDSLDECVDAAMEGEAELAIRAAIKEQT